MSNIITAHHVTDIDGNYHDRMYIFGADIADPENDPAVIFDDSTDPASWAFLITVEPSEDEQPYIDALADHGLTVVGTDKVGDWVLEQSVPLRSR